MGVQVTSGWAGASRSPAPANAQRHNPRHQDASACLPPPPRQHSPAQSRPIPPTPPQCCRSIEALSTCPALALTGLRSEGVCAGSRASCPRPPASPCAPFCQTSKSSLQTGTPRHAVGQSVSQSAMSFHLLLTGMLHAALPPGKKRRSNRVRQNTRGRHPPTTHLRGRNRPGPSPGGLSHQLPSLPCCRMAPGGARWEGSGVGEE